LGRAKSIAYADTREAALRESLSADDTVSLLVSFPDPANFALVGELGGHVVAVIDRSILRQQVGDRKIYFAQEVETKAPSGSPRQRPSSPPAHPSSCSRERQSGWPMRQGARITRT
jgi:hypothetical protein